MGTRNGAVFAVCVAVYGCQAETLTPAPTPRDVFARSLAVAICESAANCCADRGLETPGEACETAMRNAVMIAIIKAEREQRTLQAAHVDACMESYRIGAADAEDCESLPTPSEITSRCPELFTPIPEGAGEPGSDCMGTYDCRSPAHGTRQCVHSVYTVTGVCTWSVPVGANDACDPTTGIVKHCPDGLACGPAGSADACVAPAELGDACIPGSCAAGLACTVFAGPAHCVDAIGPGGTCASMPDACGENHFCGFHDTCEPLPDPCADGCEPSLIFDNICVG